MIIRTFWVTDSSSIMNHIVFEREGVLSFFIVLLDEGEIFDNRRKS